MTAMSEQHRSKTRPCNGGVQHEYKFPNGYGASVVRHDFSFGRESGLWELAVLGQDGRLTYETPITDDVIGYLSEADVNEHLAAIAALPVPATTKENA